MHFPPLIVALLVVNLDVVKANFLQEYAEVDFDSLPYSRVEKSIGKGRCSRIMTFVLKQLNGEDERKLIDYLDQLILREEFRKYFRDSDLFTEIHVQLETEVFTVYPGHQDSSCKAESLLKYGLILLSNSFPLNRHRRDNVPSKDLKCTDHHGRHYEPATGVGCLTIQHGRDSLLDVIMTVDDLLEVVEPEQLQTVASDLTISKNQPDLTSISESRCHYHYRPFKPPYVVCQYPRSKEKWHVIKDGTRFCPITESEMLWEYPLCNYSKPEVMHSRLFVNQKRFYFAKACSIRALFSVAPYSNSSENCNDSSALHLKLEFIAMDEAQNQTLCDEKNTFPIRMGNGTVVKNPSQAVAGLFHSTCPYFKGPPFYRSYLMLNISGFDVVLSKILGNFTADNPFQSCYNQMGLLHYLQPGCYQYYEWVKNSTWEQYWFTSSIFNNIIITGKAVDKSTQCNLAYVHADKTAEYRNCDFPVDDVRGLFNVSRVSLLCMNASSFSDYGAIEHSKVDINITTYCLADNGGEVITVGGLFVFCYVTRSVWDPSKVKMGHLDVKTMSALNINPEECALRDACLTSGMTGNAFHVCCCAASTDYPCNSQSVITKYVESLDDEVNDVFCSFDGKTSSHIARECNSYFNLGSRSMRCFAEYELQPSNGTDELHPVLVNEGCYIRNVFAEYRLYRVDAAYVGPQWIPLCDGNSRDNSLVGADGNPLDSCFSAIVFPYPEDPAQQHIVVCCKPESFKDRKLSIERQIYLVQNSKF